MRTYTHLISDIEQGKVWKDTQVPKIGQEVRHLCMFLIPENLFSIVPKSYSGAGGTFVPACRFGVFVP